MKQPLELATWLEYHRAVVGIERFYLRIEGTPGLKPLLRQRPWKSLVHVMFDEWPRRLAEGSPKSSDGFDEAAIAQATSTQSHVNVTRVRQGAFVNVIIPLARADGLTHLLFLDSDELLYCPNGVDQLHTALRAAPADRVDCHLRNLEALFPSRACESPFRQSVVFRHLPDQYTSYSSGKSIGRLDAPAIQSYGVHHFRVGEDVGMRGGRITYPIPPEAAVVLHYESASFDGWLTKFLELSARSTDRYRSLDRVPFRFYRLSLSAARAILDARGSLRDGIRGAARVEDSPRSTQREAVEAKGHTVEAPVSIR